MIALARHKKILGINFSFNILTKHGQWNTFIFQQIHYKQRILKTRNLDISNKYF